MNWKTKSLVLISISALFFAISGCSSQKSTTDDRAETFVKLCGSCHGVDGRGISGPSLINCSVCMSQEKLSGKIERDMPLRNASACTGECASEISSYILEDFNGKKVQ